jgi:hypothetical protein
MWSRLLCVLLFGLAQYIQAVEAIDFKLAHQLATQQTFDGIENFNIKASQTQLTTPLASKSAQVGKWTLGASITQYQFLLSGASEGDRRFYRFSAPIQYFPRQVGRFQHQWHFEPSHYSDESLISQTKDELEYAWRVKYWVNKKVSWLVGFRQDTRFGSAQIYPVFGLESQPKKGILHHWVFPDFYTQIQLNRKLNVRAYAHVEGGNWKFLQEDGSVASFGLSQWHMGIKALIKTRMKFDWMVEMGMSTMGKGSIAGNDGNLDSSYYLSFGIETPLTSSR